ncbi:MAG: hypothetical protein NZ108_07500 [Bacteroidia bacterium]|nr:hypothetical protein [Bacteroidia bacterium]
MQAQNLDDLSAIFQTKQLAYTGKFRTDDKPILIYFNKLTKQNAETYSIVGQTIHRDHRSDCTGTMKLTYQSLTDNSLQVDGKFSLRETANHPFVGTFNGSVTFNLPSSKEISPEQAIEIQKKLKFTSEWRANNRKEVLCIFSLSN